MEPIAVGFMVLVGTAALLGAVVGAIGGAVTWRVGANLALGVVAPYYCGYGGDIFAIVWDGDLHGYLGSGRSPAGAGHRERSATSGVVRRSPSG